MKKSLLFVAALLMSAMTFATTITINGTSGFKSAYPKQDGAAIEQTITVDEVNFTYMNFQYGAKDKPVTGAVSKSTIQMKSAKDADAGKVYLFNDAAITMKYIQIYTFSDYDFTLYAGTAQKPTDALVKPEAEDGTVAVTDKDDPSVTHEAAVKIYTFDVTGKTFFKLENGEKAHYLSKIVITDEEIKTVAVTGVTLDKTEATMAAYEKLQLTATVAPEDAQNKSVTWASSDEAVATVDENGLVKSWAAGTANITVTTVDGEKTATCALTVEPAKKSDFGLIKPEDLKDGDEVVITMTVDTVRKPMVMDASGATSSGPVAIVGGIIDGTIAPATDEVVFIATIKGDSITFAPKGGAEGVILYTTDNNDGVRVGKPQKNTQGGFQWAIDQETGYLNTTFIKVREGKEDTVINRYLGENNGVFKAYSKQKNGKMSTAIKDQTLKFFVKGAEPLQPVAVADVALNTAEEQLEVGKTFQLVATVSPEDAENKAVTWASADASIASVDANGLVTAVAKGETTITVTTVDGGKTASAKIVVVEPQAIENVTVDAAAVKVMREGQIFILREGNVYTVQGVRVK